MAKNDITGDQIKTKPATDKYLSGYDRIRWNNQEPKPKKEKAK